MTRTTTRPSVRPCGLCGRLRKINRAATGGDPDMCQRCWKRDRRSWTVCGTCGELRPRQGRDRDSGEPICARCYRHARPVGECESCGRVGQLARTGTRGGRRACGACAQRELRPVRVCGRCGRLAAIALMRAADGTADLCFACYARDPRGICGGCGQPAAIHARGRGGKPDLCQRCHRPPIARCSVCGRERPCRYAQTDAPVCDACVPRRVAVCVGCGRQQPVRARGPTGPLCAGCDYRRRHVQATCERCGELRRPVKHPGREVLCAGCVPTRTCPACGLEGIVWEGGQCPRCTLHRRLRQLRADAPAGVIGHLAPFLQTLQDAANSLAVLSWLTKPGGRAFMAIARGEIALSHQALDAHEQGTGTRNLRADLVRAGALPARDELLVAFERWTTARLTALGPGPDHATLRAFATWKVHRELAARRARNDRPDANGATMPKHWIRAAIELTAWLQRDGLTLADLDQSRLDTWLADGPAGRRCVRPFIAWLQQHRGARGLRVPSDPPGTKVLALDDQQRLTVLRRLLTDEELHPELRVAGCLVALYAQPAARIVRLTASDLLLTVEAATICLGTDPIALPAQLRPAAAQLLQRATTAREPWLFPGAMSGQPGHPSALANRLKRLGVPVAQTRPSALAALAHRIPPAVLAELLGLSASTACRISADLKTDYARYVARRT